MKIALLLHSRNDSRKRLSLGGMGENAALNKGKLCCAQTFSDGDVMTQQVRLGKGKKCYQYATAANNGVSTLYARYRRCRPGLQRKVKMRNDDKMRLLGYVCLSYAVKESYLLSVIFSPLRLKVKVADLRIPERTTNLGKCQSPSNWYTDYRFFFRRSLNPRLIRE